MIHFALALLPSPAYACGGMFCDAVVPVDQAAERIVFTFDGPDVVTEVQITYQGQDDDFAWVVPVPEEPELFASNDALFTQMANSTVPTYTLQSDSTGGGSLGCAQDMNLSASKDSAGGFEDGDGVSVVSEGTVGPYDTVVLQAENADTLITWLQEQGYNLPDEVELVVEPYVASGQYFVALKLSSDKDTGDLAPLGMRYAATAASIPIQLTSIATIPDLPIEVFVIGESRAVPDNYLHVQLNEAAINWYGGGNNARALVARAADEAGGQAFATEFSGSTDIMANQLWFDGMVDVTYLAGLTDPISWVESIVFSGIPASSQLNALLTDFVPPPSGVDDVTFLSCPSCYSGQVSAPDFDPVVATEAFRVEIVEVLHDQQKRIDAAGHLTRMITTMDAEEMTADPIFVLNADIEQDVSQSHIAIDHTRNAFFSGDVQARTLELADGREYKFSDPQDTNSMDAVELPVALIIEDLSATGEGTIVFDGREDAKADAVAFSGGCASEAADSGAIVAPVLLLLAGALRRRRG
ncbi:hypothetical protein LBMAG42_07350 [Deltaproteobacteria bacterium]|nr:hypothetical protein LBMAG42_07350 [Deltaproteobacteria bacterium]